MRMLALAAVAALLMPATADAAIKQFRFRIDASGFGAGAPVDPVTLIVSGTYDDSIDESDLPLTVTQSTIPFTKTPEFFHAGGIEFFTFGTSTYSNFSYEIQDGDFGFFVAGPGIFGSDPVNYSVPQGVKYGVGGVIYVSSTATVTPLAIAPGAPAPLLGIGLLPALAAGGAFGVSRRRRRGAPVPA